jgi:hypothetical protein
VTAEAKRTFNQMLIEELDESCAKVAAGWCEGVVCVDGKAVLKLCVEMPMYEVMTCKVGVRGEKREDYRMDKKGKRKHWEPRLVGRRYDLVKVYGGTNIFDEAAPWTLFKWRRNEESILSTRVFTAGPYSNGALREFPVRKGFPLHTVHLGVVVGRHHAKLVPPHKLLFSQGSTATENALQDLFGKPTQKKTTADRCGDKTERGGDQSEEELDVNID